MQKSVANMDNSAGHFLPFLLHYIKNKFREFNEHGRRQALMTLNNFDEFIDKTDFLQTRLLQVNSCGSERVVKYDYTILSISAERLARH